MRVAVIGIDDPLFLDMMTDVVVRTIKQYQRGKPLRLVPENRT